MSHYPTFQKGQIIRAKDLNTLSNGLRYISTNRNLNPNTNKNQLDPFDVKELYLNDDGMWEFILEPAYYWNHRGGRENIIYGHTPLSAYPPIVINGIGTGSGAPESNLVFNYRTKKLGWQSKDQFYNLMVIETKVEEDNNIQLINHHPIDVDIRMYPPFTELVVNDGHGSISVGVTPGKVIERIVTTGNCVKAWEPSNLYAGSELSFFDISDGNQLAVIVNTDDTGKIAGDDPVILQVELDDTASTHYQPVSPGEDEGTDGEYHYPLVQNGGGTILCARSHIYYDEDIDQLVNTGDPAAAGDNEGRVLKEWNEDDSEWVLRRVRAIAGQLHCNENDDSIDFRGNSIDGSLTISKISPLGNQTVKIEWEDGFDITPGDQAISFTETLPISGGTGELFYKIGNTSPTPLHNWINGIEQDSGNFTVPIPEIVAGDNITISVTDNVYTISTTDPLSGSWVNVWVCDEGVQVEKQVYMRDIPT